MQNIITLAELSVGIRNLLEVNFESVKVKAEAIQCKRYPSGHLYFVLKENDHTIDCVCWKSAKIAFEPQDGIEVICTGKVTSYSGRSKYQLNITNIEHSGLGEILKAIEERKKKLAKEGLFDADRKLPIPKYIYTIGIITSSKGAVIHDMLHRLRDRYPVKVVLYPIPVQGSEVANSSINGINYFHNNPVDVIILARGGGSFEDLLGFQDENLVRAVAASKIPLVTAIGHETDTTLVDYASSLRAPTPTAAIELITPDRNKMLSELDGFQNYLNNNIHKLIETQRTILQGTMKVNEGTILDMRMQKYDYSWAKFMSNIKHYLYVKEQKISIVEPNFSQQYKNITSFESRNSASILNILELLENKLEQSANLLKAVSYKNTLKRGFCRAFADKTQVTTCAAAMEQKDFCIEFQDGIVKTRTL